MGKKGAKKKEAEDKSKPIEEPEPDDEQRELVERELLISHLKLRLGTTQIRGNELESENKDLHTEVDTQKSKLKDINEFLTNEIKAKEKLIDDLEQQLKDLEAACEKLKADHKDELAQLEAKKDEEIDALQGKIVEYEDQLKNLKEFQEKKNALEEELNELRSLLHKERKERESQINELERRVVQDKDRLKKEMSIKVKETRSNMMKLTDDHLKATTKRTIMENQQFYSELAYQSRQTEKLLQKNETLLSENADYKRKLELSMQTEADLVKKNSVYQKTIKLLHSKLQEVEAKKSEAEQRSTKLATSMSDLERVHEDVSAKLNEMTFKADDATYEVEKKSKEFEDYKMTRHELEMFLITSLDEVKKQMEVDASESRDIESSFLPESIKDYTAQQKETLLMELLAKLDGEYDGGRGIRTSSSIRSAANVYMPALSSRGGRPYSSNVHVIDGVLETGLVSERQDFEKTTKSSNVGIQTADLFTPEMEFFRENIRNKERPWGKTSKTLPLTHMDARTFLRKAEGDK